MPDVSKTVTPSPDNAATPTCFENKIIIEGVTENGHKFRPSDWADRMCGSLSTFRDRRVHYSPMFYPANIDGNPCVIMDSALKELHPSMFIYALEFAEENQLRVRNKPS